MSALTSGAGSGVVLGIVLVLLGQQFGLFDLSSTVPAVEFLIAGAVAFGIVGAGIGWSLGRRYRRRHPVPP
ncbi:MAG TPA: hypothetical protein VGV64_05315 [Thermoplasmata archaeon]|nr:hypothetical protein [Thermoplasmata archaeon]